MVGTILKYMGTRLPVGYAWANDTRIPKSKHAQLYSLIAPNVHQDGDHFYMPSGDDLHVLGREIATNKTWINGQRVYRYGFEISAFPNNTTDTLAIEDFITPLEIVSISGICNNGVAYFQLPRPDNATTATAIEVWVDLNSKIDVDLKIRTRWDASTYSGYVFVEYTKASIRSSPSGHIIKIGDK